MPEVYPWCILETTAVKKHRVGYRNKFSSAISQCWGRRSSASCSIMHHPVWIVALIFTALGATSAVDCNDISLVTECYENLVHYENLGFPLYGETRRELDETCKIMNDSFQYIYHFMSACHDSSDCGKDCDEVKADIGVFLLNTGLRDLENDLCNPVSGMRHTYLENYKCLESNANEYAACHNDSQMSQEYMATLTEPKDIIQARCCYMYWYHDCFTNITRDRCSDNATVFISFTLHKLIGQIAHQLCGNNQVVCDRPPLPMRDNDILDSLDKPDRTNHDVDNAIEALRDEAAAGSQRLQVVFLFLVFCFSLVMSKRVLL